MSEKQDAFYDLAPLLVDTEVDEEGVAEFAGRRFVYFHTDMFAQLFENMREVAGPVVDREIGKFGFQAGKFIGEEMDEEFKDVSAVKILKLVYKSGFNISAIQKIADTDNLSQIEKISGYGKYVGWLGDMDFPEYKDGEKVVLTVENTFESDSYGETGQKQCKFMSNTFAGILSYYWDSEDVEAEEVQCSSEGHEKCKMVITNNE
jgi:predicted hydrocarbon binding protein